MKVAGFEVPKFTSGERKCCKGHYVWWSWHPSYPYWSKSCWGGSTIKDAKQALKGPWASKMKYYHNKLIHENEGIFTEVLDVPTKEVKVWERIAKQIKASKK